jgi:hypothetical protein
VLARGLLDKAIETYLRGFEADWRDAYPAVNALTLMEARNPPDPRREELLHVVAYVNRSRIERPQDVPSAWFAIRSVRP